LKINMPFIQNQGQAADEVRFYSPTGSGTVFVTDGGEIVYALPDSGLGGKNSGWCLREKLVGAAVPSIEGQDRVSTTFNYFQGNDQGRRQSRVPAFGSVVLENVYSGIDVALHAFSSEVEKRFYLDPHAHPDRIRIRVSGAQGLCVNLKGELEAMTQRGPITFTRPVAWQEEAGQRSYVDVAYRVEGDMYSFSLGKFDPEKRLIIDPMLGSTFHGGAAAETGYASVLGLNNDLYVGGYTASDPFPVTPGAYDGNYNGGGYDAYVARFDRDLTTLMACTYLGGSGDEGWYYLGLATDADGNVFVTGNTSTNDFPIMPGAYDDSYNGGPATGPYGTGGDQFIAKLSGDLSTLIASTYLGGSGFEYGRAIVLDDQGNVYVGGSTSSTDFPVSPGAYDEWQNGNGDAYVACLDNSLSTRIAASYLGGATDEYIEVIRLDANGNLFVTGWTQSTNFPTPNGADPTYNGGMYDVFVSKFSSDLSSLPGSTFLGGSQWEFGYAMDLDADGNVFVGGHAGKTFPTTPGAYCETYNGTLGQNFGDDVFITKFDNSLSQVLVSTYLGGNKWENATCMVVDEEGNLFVSGTTSSTNFPAPPGSYDRKYNGGTKYSGDLFITRLNSSLTELLASTYIGGTSEDGGYTMSLLLEPEGGLILASETASLDFPMVPGGADPDFNGYSDMVVFKMDRALTADPSLDTDAGTISASTGGVLSLTLHPGADYAERTYLILGTVSGTEPGFTLPGGLMDLPIHWDAFTDVCLLWLNSPVFSDFYGALDLSGHASAQISSGPVPGFIGTVMHYAFTLNNPFDFASNAVRIEIIP
ncbi:MAG: SBBP repeat-containing protein, partial [Planctomycetota bacterium]